MPTRREILLGASILPLIPGPGAADQPTTQSVPLRFEVARVDLGMGNPTAMLRMGGLAEPGVLRLARAVPAVLNFENALGRASSLELVGVRGTKLLRDGGGTTIAPGGKATFLFTPPDSGTYWLRPALDPDNLAARGLGAVLVVDDAAPALSATDVVLGFATHGIDASEQLVGLSAGGSAKPEVTLVNGLLAPLLRSFAPATRLRLRLLNQSTDRVGVVAVEGAHPLILAVDGQPSDLFAPGRDTVPIGPGASFDLLVDVPPEAGSAVRVLLRGPAGPDGKSGPDVPLALLKSDGPARSPQMPAKALPPNSALPTRIPLERARRAELVIEGTTGAGKASWRIAPAGAASKSGEPVIRLKRGDAVTLGFENRSTELVALRVEGQAMRLLHPRDDGWEPYWRNTLLLPPVSRNHVSFVADTAGDWLIEGCFEAQAVSGLRCRFTVAS